MKFYVEDKAFEDIARLANKCGVERAVLFDQYREPDNPKNIHVDIAVSGGDTPSFCAEFSVRKYFIRQYHVTDIDRVSDLKLRKKIEDDGVVVYDRNTFSESMLRSDCFYAPIHVTDIGIGGGERFAFNDRSGNDTVIGMTDYVTDVHIVCDDREIIGRLWDASEKSQLVVVVKKDGEREAIPLEKCRIIEFVQSRKIGR